MFFPQTSGNYTLQIPSRLNIMRNAETTFVTTQGIKTETLQQLIIKEEL